MTKSSTVIVHMDRTFSSVMKDVPKYAWAFRLQYGVGFTEERIKDIGHDIMPS